jgi:hypothetical protein
MPKKFMLGLNSALAALGLMAALSSAAFSQSDEPDQYGTGLIPISPEEFARLPKTPTYRAFLPERVDLSSNFPLPGDQGQEGSCAAWAVGYAARAYYASAAERRDLRDLANIPSPAYIYSTIVENPADCKSGTRVPDALNLLKNSGSFSLKAFPYRVGQCSPPSDSQHLSATDFQIADWIGVDYESLDQIKGELAEGHPVIIGIQHATRALSNLKRGQILHFTGYAEGQHAVTLVGYDEHLQAFKLINSWSTRWADGGFGWIGYDAFHAYVDEAYVMRPRSPHIPNPPLGPPDLVVRPSPPTPVQVPPPIVPVNITGLECGHVLDVQRGGKQIFTGFVGSDADLAKLQNQARNTNASVEVAVRPWPQCEVLLTLEKALAPPEHPIVKIENAGRLAEASGDATETNDYLKFTVTTPPYPSFLHAAYIQADGSVVNVVQPNSVNLTAYPPSTKIVLGDIHGGGAKFKVGPPYGREMLVVLAGRSPLFDAPRAVEETEREFLTALRGALIAKPDLSAADRRITAGFDTVVTSDTAVIFTDRQQP